MAHNFETIRVELKVILEEALKANDPDLLEIRIKAFKRPDVDFKSPLDQVFRDVLLDLLERESPVTELQKLVSFCIVTCRKQLTTATMPVMLLVDIFDALTLDICEVMFSFVENQVNVWKEELFFMSCKNNLLRMCNDLLRRLSRSSATVFCGRILLFLAKFFPFSERSGLNIVSEFNLENVTEYGGEGAEESTTEIEVGETGKNIVIDYSLYCKFWSLQDFFRNPNQCYNKVQWKLFCSHATSILNTFQGLKLESISKNQIESFADEERTPYFSKYLTNQKLLDLQIYDVNFRRFVLLQFLILFQYLTSSVKFKSESFELNSTQKEFVQTMIEKIYSLLKETPPDGEKFAQIVVNIFQREEHWNIWKNEGCPEFKKSISQAEPQEKRKSISEKPFLGDILKEANSNGKYYLGSNELTKLWNLYPNNLEACKVKDRDFLPSLENYFADAVEQVESTQPKSDDENLLKDGNFGWRALRLLARRSPHFFTYSNNPINQLPDYLLMMVKKIAADRPGRTQENPDQNDAELEANLFKQEESNEEMKQEDGDEHDENYIKFKVTIVTFTQFDNFCNLIAPDWKKLANRLNFKVDEVEYIETQNKTDVECTRNMLNLWFEDDDDSTLDNFSYLLEGLKMEQAAEAVKEAIAQNQNLAIS